MLAAVQHTMPFLKRLSASLLRIAAGVPIVCLLVGGIVFSALSLSVTGRGVGLSATIFGVVLFCCVGYWQREWFKRIRRRFLAVSILLGVLLYAAAMAVGPDGGSPQVRVRNCYLGGGSHFGRWWPWNVAPEADQIHVGLALAALGTPEINMAEARRIDSLVLPLYAEMDKDADFQRLGSAMGMAYRDLARCGSGAGHYFAVVPENTNNRPVACLVFLHGMGGNVKPCLWVLSKLSAETGCAVIAPTFGNGDWDKPDAARFTIAVVREALATLPIDPNRIYLMGYSNGAMGVTRAVVDEPTLFRGLIYLSPVTEDELFSTPEFLAGKSGRPMLFLEGGRDKRIPRAIVDGTVSLLKRLDCNVRLKVFEQEDHYLIFSQQQAVLDEIKAMLQGSP